MERALGLELGHMSSLKSETRLASLKNQSIKRKALGARRACDHGRDKKII